MYHESPVADLVAEAFNHDATVGRQYAGDRQLLDEVRPQIPPCVVVQRRVPQPVGRCGPLDRAQELSDCLSHLKGPALGVRMPERQLARFARSGGDQNPVVGDLLDAPRRGAQRDDIPDPRFVDHLLVEFPDPAVLGPDDEHREQPTVRDRAAGDHRGALCTPASAQHVGAAVPDDARTQLREVVGGIPSGEHVEHRLVRRPGQVGVTRRSGDQFKERIDVPVLHGDHGHDLLAQDVQRVAGDTRGFDAPGGHALHSHCGGQQISAVGREEDALADRVEAVSGATEPLQARRHRRRAPDLHHEVDGAHVDTQFQAAGGDHRRQPT